MNTTTPLMAQAQQRLREKVKRLLAHPDRANNAVGLLLQEMEPALLRAMENIVLSEPAFKRSELEAAMSRILAQLMSAMAQQLTGDGRTLQVATGRLATDAVLRLHVATANMVANGGPDGFGLVRNENGALVDVDPLAEFLKGDRT